MWGEAVLPTASTSRPVVLQVAGCDTELVDAKPYLRRYKICQAHYSQSSIYINGTAQRFCQQVGRAVGWRPLTHVLPCLRQSRMLSSCWPAHAPADLAKHLWRSAGGSTPWPVMMAKRRAAGSGWSFTTRGAGPGGKRGPRRTPAAAGQRLHRHWRIAHRCEAVDDVPWPCFPPWHGLLLL